MYEKPCPNKLRNSTIIIGVLLLLFSFTQIELDTSKTIVLFGLPLRITNSNFITYTLIGLSLYFLFRYWFYSMRKKSTWNVRSLIWDNLELTDDVEAESNVYVIDRHTREEILEEASNLRHSGINYSNMGYHENDDKTWCFWVRNPRNRSISTLIKDLDFLFPLVVNVVAIACSIYYTL